MNVGATSPATSANTDFVSDRGLDDLYDLSVLTAEENGWEAEPREQFEARYRDEIAARNNKVSDR
jgi:hypothetical protein